jgi:hypothetical protein
MTRSLTMNDYQAEVWTAQKLVERVFSSSSCSCSKILGRGANGIRLRPQARAYGATGLMGHRGHIVSLGGINVPGVLMLFNFRARGRGRGRERLRKALVRC